MCFSKFNYQKVNKLHSQILKYIDNTKIRINHDINVIIFIFEREKSKKKYSNFGRIRCYETKYYGGCFTSCAI